MSARALKLRFRERALGMEEPKRGGREVRAQEARSRWWRVRKGVVGARARVGRGLPERRRVCVSRVGGRWTCVVGGRVWSRRERVVRWVAVQRWWIWGMWLLSRLRVWRWG